MTKPGSRVLPRRFDRVEAGDVGGEFQTDRRLRTPQLDHSAIPVVRRLQQAIREKVVPLGQSFSGSQIEHFHRQRGLILLSDAAQANEHRSSGRLLARW